MQPNLVKYLFKTICTDITTEILNYISTEENLNTVTDNYNNEQRVKFINSLPTNYRSPLQNLAKSLSGQSIEDFMSAVEEALMSCSMILKKIDKKKDRVIILNHKHGLLERLTQCDDPALVLHLTTLVLFICATQSMVHASGKHVAGLLHFLSQYLSSEQIQELNTFHGEY